MNSDKTGWFAEERILMKTSLYGNENALNVLIQAADSQGVCVDPERNKR